MNLSFYEALDRITARHRPSRSSSSDRLAVAVAGSRRPVDLLWALLDGPGGIVALTRGGVARARRPPASR